jgi:hypothetical protein
MLDYTNLEGELEESIRIAKQRKRPNVKLNGTNHAGANVLALAPAAELAPSAPQLLNDTRNSITPLPDVYRAICQVAKEISRDGIAKGRRNEAQGYGFRGIDDVYNALSALLAGADLCVLPRMLSRTQEERPTAKGGVLFYVTVHAEFDFVSARDASQHTVMMFGEAMDSADKATNKAMSAAYKYCCMQVFCIPTEGMADADATTPEPAPRTAPPPPAAPRPELKKTPPPLPPPQPESKKIDTGGHPMNTQAAADYVAQQKIGAARAKEPAPWVSRGQMRTAFARVRERVGADAYRDILARYGAKFGRNGELNWAEASAALECYHELIEKAVA